MPAKKFKRDGLAWPLFFWNGKQQQNNPAEIRCLVFAFSSLADAMKETHGELKKWKEKEQKLAINIYNLGKSLENLSSYFGLINERRYVICITLAKNNL